MKTYLFSLFAMLFFVCAATAQKIESAELKISNGKSVTNYKYTSIRDFNANTDEMLSASVSAQIQQTGKADTCMTTISMTVTVTAGSGSLLPGGQVSVTVTGSITVSCSQAISAGRRLKEQLVEMAS